LRGPIISPVITRNGSNEKSQISSTKLQINLKYQTPMTQTPTFWDLEFWTLGFDIWNLGFVILGSQLMSLKKHQDYHSAPALLESY
jgi:hypothetical protein